MQITLNIDKRGYKEKPDRRTAGGISNNVRQKSGQKTIAPVKILDYIRQGYTFTPAAIGGNLDEWKPYNREKGHRVAETNPVTGRNYQTSDFWESQQIIVADIDNENPGRQLTPSAALDVCRSNGLEPFCIYNTFSNTEEHNKFRILFILEEPITEFDTAADYIQRVAALFNSAVPDCADTSIEPVKLIFGGRQDAIIYHHPAYISIDSLEALPKPPTIAPVNSRTEKRQNTPQKYTEATEGQPEADLLISALFAIPPQSLDYKEWLKIGAALKYAGIDYATFDEWNRQDTGTNEEGRPRYNEEQNFKTWNSFSNTAGNPATAATVYYYAKQNNWRFPEKEKKQTTADKEGETMRELENFFAEATPAADPTEAEAYNPENMTPPPEMQPQAEPKTPLFLSAADYLTGLYETDIEELKQYAGRKMGLHPDIDKHLTLFPGLAALGGQASLGKTTFAINMVYKLLKRGEHVLYFALEQRPEELITKSLAAYIYKKNPETSIDNLQLNNGLRNTEVDDAMTELAKELSNYHLIECDFETTAADIEAMTDAYMQTYPGVKPIVIIDYLQLIAPPADFKGDTRARIDENLKSIKKMQKTRGLFVLVISSFNRSSNFEPISYESFKETSMIEFTCDYVFGLQLAIQDPRNEEFYVKIGPQFGKSKRQEWEQKEMIHKAQIQTPKQIQFVSIKNRRGKQYFTANFNYYPAHDSFEEGQALVYRSAFAEDPEPQRRPKTPQQDAEEKTIEIVFDNCEFDGRADLHEMVEYWGGNMTAKKMQKLLTENGNFIVTGNIVVKAPDI